MIDSKFGQKSEEKHDPPLKCGYSANYSRSSQVKNLILLCSYHQLESPFSLWNELSLEILFFFISMSAPVKDFFSQNFGFSDCQSYDRSSCSAQWWPIFKKQHFKNIRVNIIVFLVIFYMHFEYLFEILYIFFKRKIFQKQK